MGIEVFRGGVGYLLPLGGLLACLAGVWVSVVAGFPIRTMATVGIPLAFVLPVLGWTGYRIQQLRSVGERDPEIREYLEDR